MAERIVDTTTVSRRRIIERPRLTRLLDESPARIKMLVAPAGYGKTTLARQWVASQPAATAWIVADASSVDVAALARNVQAATSKLAPRSGSALLERLAVTPDAEHEAETLAEILASDLTDWNDGCWLIIDDYHLIAGSSPPERFIESLLLRSALNVLLLSRQRPTWASARRILYGEIFELDTYALAMNSDEAAAVLNAGEEVVGPLVEASGGWPAVLSLASMSSGERPTLEPSSLYRFFAEELFQRVAADDQQALCRMALIEFTHREEIAKFMGAAAERAVRVGIAHGFLTEHGSDGIDLHPLLRAFLLDKFAAAPADLVVSNVEHALDHLVREGHWEEALELADRFSGGATLPSLDEQSVERLLHSGRTTTLRRWLSRTGGSTTPGLQLAAAELAFREGHYYESETMAELAAEGFRRGSPSATRAMILAARAAHAASREERALSLYREARSSAASPELGRIAALGELAAAVELELPSSIALYDELGPADQLEPHERVVYVGRGLNLQTRFGLRPSLDLARSVAQLVHLLDDPVARSSFRNVFAHTLASSGHYDEASALIEEQLDDADRCRLDFVVPYAQCVQAVVHCARREYTLTDQALDAAEARSRRSGDLTAQFIAASIRTRALVARGAAEAAIRIPMITGEEITPSLKSELLASLALAHAVAGSHAQSSELADVAEGISVAAETVITAPLARAIVALRDGRDDAALGHLRRSVERVGESGLIECLVCACRACPELVVTSVADDQIHRTLADALYRADETTLLATMDAVREGSVRSLSPREKQVLRLIGHGLSNREIATRLFISPVTVKVHVRHIFEKLGVRSRTAAALRASQLDRD